MPKKFRVRVSAMILCAAMVITAMAVLAAEVTETVALDWPYEGRATAFISGAGYAGSADTSGVSPLNDILMTQVNGYGDAPNVGYGVSHADTTGAFDYVVSFHKWTHRTHSITVRR